MAITSTMTVVSSGPSTGSRMERTASSGEVSLRATSTSTGLPAAFAAAAASGVASAGRAASEGGGVSGGVTDGAADGAVAPLPNKRVTDASRDVARSSIP